MKDHKNAGMYLEKAFALDRHGREAEAIPLYQRAIKLGVKGRLLRDALVCLGSSLRGVGQGAESVRCLERARKLFPRDVVVEIFLALAYHGAGDRSKALRMVARALLRESTSKELAGYRRALERKIRTLR